MSKVSTAELLHVLHYRDSPDNLPDVLNRECDWDGTVYGMVGVPGSEAAQLGDEKHDGVLYFAPSVGESDREKLAQQRHLRASEPNNRPVRDWRNVLGEANTARERDNHEQRATPKPVALPLPPTLRCCSVFFVSAWNPKGRSRRMEDNLKGSSLLRADIAALKKGELKAPLWPGRKMVKETDITTAAVAPQAVWEGFDWNLLQGWRAEGFCLAYMKPFADQGRDAVMALARKHGQNFVLEYEPLPCEYQGDPGRMTRRTVSFVVDAATESATDVTQMLNLAQTWHSDKITIARVAQPTWPAPK